MSSVAKRKPEKIVNLVYNQFTTLPAQENGNGRTASQYLLFQYETAIIAGLASDMLQEFEKEGKGLYNFLIAISKKRIQFLDNKSSINALYLIYRYKGHWVRDISSWEKKSYNLEKQIKSIARHLLCKYDIPKFMDNIWFQGFTGRNLNDRRLEEEETTWTHRFYIHIGQGKNPRTFGDFPLDISLSKKEAHYFLKAPENYFLLQAVRWAQFISAGGDKRLIKYVMESRLGARHTYQELSSGIGSKKMISFWTTILQFFAKQPMLDGHVIAPLCDYIHHMRFGRGGAANNQRMATPSNPNFTMKGRTIDSLTRGMEGWHAELNKEQKNKRRKLKSWKGFDIGDYEVTIGKNEHKKIYSFKQVTTSAELSSEGSAHGHCVYSFLNSCAEGYTSIWSMTVFGHSQVWKQLITLEINRNSGILEMRGKGNRPPTENEMRVIRLFAQKRNLIINHY